MRRVFLLLAFCWLSGISASAQYSTEYEVCIGTAQAQNAMNQCASDEAARADGRLNAAYRSLLKAAGHDEFAVAKFRAFEKAWTIYRNAYISAMYPADDKQGAYGSIFPMESDLLWARLSREQEFVLEKMRNHYEQTAPDAVPAAGNGSETR